jgi:putative PIN family toxin of toxin-antitoxin system
MRAESKPPKIVLDTGILAAALIFPGSNSDQIFQKIRRGEMMLVTSSFILQELRKFIKQKLKYKNDEIDYVIKNISKLARVVEPHHRAKVFPDKKETNRILECAVEGKASFIITMDSKQLQPLKKFEGVWIMSPAVFLRTKIYSFS